MKPCTRCGTEKPLDEYHRNKRKKDGRDPDCKACASARRARPEAKAQRAEYRAANRVRIADWRATYYAENREQILARKAEYNAEHRDQIRAYDAEYRAGNPHVMWESNYRRRAIGYGFEPVIESFTKDELIERHGDKCFHCGGEWSETDHFPIPVYRGGHHTLETVVPSCAPCNQRSWRSSHD